MDLTWESWSRGIRPHGLLCGLLMIIWAYWVRDWDAPVPLIAVYLFLPYPVLSGFLAARRHGVDAGMAAGLATAVTAHVMVFSAAVVYSAAIQQPWQTPVILLAIGVLLVGFTALVGLFCGRLGAGLAGFGRSPSS
jgi:hypothetical protein